MRGSTGSWRSTIVSSGVLSLALLGDALIYVVLPVHAEAFGVGIVWVGVLLSVNRFVRVFAYGWIARITFRFGMRRMCVAAAAAAVVSTSLYGFGQGISVLLAARILWGLAYAALVLVTLAYAVELRAQAGVRVGWSRAIQRLGPIAALLAGAWMASTLGPRSVFLVLAAFTAIALPLALSLPADHADTAALDVSPNLGRPRAIDCLFFIQGFGVDGVFAISITLLLAQEVSLSLAVLSGGVFLALRHVGEALAAPLFGAIGDRHGAARVFAGSLLMTSLGFGLIAFGLTVAGALLMLVFRGALASLGPITVVQTARDDESVIGPLARMQAWRDMGAAVGPLVTGFALSAVSAEFMHGVVAVLMVLGLVRMSYQDGNGSKV